MNESIRPGAWVVVTTRHRARHPQSSFPINKPMQVINPGLYQEDDEITVINPVTGERWYLKIEDVELSESN